jgi:hypothetical protein
MLHPQAPKDQPWFWTITAREIPPSVHNRGYSVTREQAMADFKMRWRLALIDPPFTYRACCRPLGQVPLLGPSWRSACCDD